jgi:myo-inositol-1(or 4)-monophosphatase
MQLEKALIAARETALLAGTLLRERLASHRTLSTKDTAIDIVTEVDLESEALCQRELLQRFPANFLGEESGGAAPETDALLWVVDPLDGTVNYAHRFPFFCVSIALCQGRTPLVGAIYEPMRNELVSAARGLGAFCNDERLRVTREDTLERALLATGFPYDRHTSADNNLDLHARFTKLCQGIRRAGAAALDLCYVAAGRFDGYWEKKLKPWDLAAGELIVEEAGGIVTDLSGKPTDPFSLECLASNGPLHPAMLAVIRG